MTINLSSLVFSNQADIVPPIGTIDSILNTGIANTLAGDDVITGTRTGYGIKNYGTIDTDVGNDTITGSGYYGIINSTYGNTGTIDTGAGNDTITGSGGYGIVNYSYSGGYTGTIDTGAGNDTITGSGSNRCGIQNYGTIDTGAGNDTITGRSDKYGIENYGTIDTDVGNDTIIGSGSRRYYGIFNYDAPIDTGAGNDTITGTGTRIGIYNGGTIDTGAGNDIVDARTGGFGGSGTTRLGDNNDIIKGFGSGSFYGGTGIDRLELTAGTYTVGISGSVTSLTRNGIAMSTSEFERLVAGSSTYNFTALRNGQTITVA